MLRWWFLLGGLVACQYTAPATNDAAPIDAPEIDAPPDAGPCETLVAACNGDTLSVCEAVGQPPVETACTWGCGTTPAPHCNQLDPTGGALTADDLLTEIEGGVDIEISTATTMNTNSGEITGIRPVGLGVQAGIEFIQRGQVAVFRFTNLRITSQLAIIGNRAVAIVALGDIEIDAIVDARGPCSGIAAGPGGRAGSNVELAAASQPGGGGSSGSTGSGNRPAGGGGGHAGPGGNGGDGNGATQTPGGGAFGDPEIASLTDAGGAGGGCGGGTNPGGGVGGGGGGAVQMVANGTITITSGGINAGGCGGKTDGEAGGGGGSGGAILLEAPAITIAAGAGLAANGGGGGGGQNGGNGDNGALSETPADGGGNGARSGGNGAAGTELAGQPGDNQNPSGGGGGAAGRIRLRTRDGTITNAGFVSPALDAAAEAAAAVRTATVK